MIAIGVILLAFLGIGAVTRQYSAKTRWLILACIVVMIVHLFLG